MPTSMACDELACCRIRNCCCIWARLVLSGWNLIVRGTIFRSSAVPNNEQSCWVFHVLGESCSTIVYQIWSRVFFFNDYNLRSFCKHLRSMQHFFSNSRILFCCFKRSRAFLSSLFFSVCILLFVPCGAK